MQTKSPSRMPVVPLRDVVVFPRVTLPLYVGREKSLRAIEEARKGSGELLLITQESAQSNDPQLTDLHTIGTRAVIRQFAKLADGNVKILVEGLERVSLSSFSAEPFFEASYSPLPLERTDSETERKWMLTLLKHVEGYFKALSRPFHEIAATLEAIHDPHELIDIVAAQVPLRVKDKQEVLEIQDPIKRMEKLSTLILSELEILLLDRKIKDQVREKIEKSQKEYFLNEQMSAIQKELGGEGNSDEEIRALEKRLLEKIMPTSARERCVKELKRLKSSHANSPELGVIRSYVELILDLPWDKISADNTDIRHAENILNEDHFGIKDVKERILEFLAVRAKTESHKSPVLCLVGPPGVGKTSLAKSIARSLNRKFERVSLGGLRDESELRGHRRTYIAALPGKIISAIRKAGESNPVILLDEIDKMGMDFRGDPASVLLEILDPEQNKHFSDHYLDLEYDLSKVLFISTANLIDPLSPPLRDRMEIISLSGYSEMEKVQIAKSFLIPRELANHALSAEALTLSEELISYIVRNYTKEAGVRNLQKEIAKICRKIVRKDSSDLKPELAVFEALDKKAIESYLGVPRFKASSLGMQPEVGVVTGLAWTSHGGELLAVEANILPGKGKVQITGQLGNIMQESAKAALSYIRSRAYRYGLSDDYFATKDIHLHFPEGAIPKDGPSAGVTVATAILSAILKIPVSKQVGMTGEITLRGKVLPIGGLKEKLLAARRGELQTVFYPFENEKDKSELESSVTEGLELIPVFQMDEIIEKVLSPSTKPLETSDYYIHQQGKGSSLGPSSPLLLNFDV